MAQASEVAVLQNFAAERRHLLNRFQSLPSYLVTLCPGLSPTNTFVNLLASKINPTTSTLSSEMELAKLSQVLKQVQEQMSTSEEEDKKRQMEDATKRRTDIMQINEVLIRYETITQRTTVWHLKECKCQRNLSQKIDKKLSVSQFYYQN